MNETTDDRKDNRNKRHGNEIISDSNVTNSNTYEDEDNHNHGSK